MSTSSSPTSRSTSSTFTGSTTSNATTTTSQSPTSGLFSSTFSPPPQSTDSGGGNGNNFNPTTSIASSASLYLYTFLATLVLLLSVSGAIILRSLIIRRRHRLMVEEAIRNGTWVPPSPGAGPFGIGGRSPKVDLSKKPVMWEAYVGGSEKDQLLEHANRAPQTDWDWDSLRPFSAAYVAQPPGQPLPLRLPTPVAPSGDGAAIGLPPPLSYRRRLVRFLRPNLESSAPYPLNQRPTTRSEVNLNGNAAVDWDGRPKKLRVAVLIAMPRPPDPDGGAKSPSSSGPPVASSSSSPVPAPSPAPPLDEEEIPLVEFGVAELEVRQPENEEEAAQAQGKDEGRASGSGSLEV